MEDGYQNEPVALKLVITKKDLDRFKDTIAQWKENPNKLMEWAQEQGQMGLLILSHIMQHPKGRSGPYHAISATKEITNLLEALTRFNESMRDEDGGRQRSEEANSGLECGLSDGPPGYGAEGSRGEPAPGETEADAKGPPAGERMGMADGEGPSVGEPADLDEGREG
jgi:hypothetical protein